MLVVVVVINKRDMKSTQQRQKYPTYFILYYYYYYYYYYMDNLKFLRKSEEELQKQIQTVTTFSDDNHKEFGLDRCAKIVFKKGKLIHSQNLVVDVNREIQKLEQGKTYKYLGVEESDGIQ
jgi:hypothetical protein